MAEVPMFSNGGSTVGAGDGAGRAPMPLCTAAYDEPTQLPRQHSHVCDLDHDHSGPHFCSACGTHWVARTGVPGGKGADGKEVLSEQQKQVALSRMDAHQVGTGFVMVRRSEDGKYTYLRLDPEQISLRAPEDGWPDEATADDVGRTAAEILQRRHVQNKLKLMIAEGDERSDRHRGWVHTALLKSLLDEQ